MTTTELVKNFTNLQKQNDHQKAATKYNADNVVSYESDLRPDGRLSWQGSRSEQERRGGRKSRRARRVWGRTLCHGDGLSFFTMDVTLKATGKRIKMDEVGVYTVKNGKIVSERFRNSQA